MALIKCPECGGDISDKAKVCTHCGYPIQEEQPRQTETHSVDKPKERTGGEGVQLPPNSTNTKKNTIIIVAGVVAVIAAALILFGITAAARKQAAKKRDLSDVFDFSFSWTMQDVIKYEAEEFGNTEYRYDADVNRLDFEPYDNESYWKHSYFFDKETGNLNAVDYSGALSDYGGNPECEHVKPLRKKLLDVIGDWDEKATGKEVRSVAYGQIDRVPVKILDFNMPIAPQIYITKTDD